MIEINTAAIPAELKLLPQWVAFSVKPDPDNAGKLKKIPYIAQVGLDAKASSTDSNTWRTYDNMLAFIAQAPEVLKPGFVFTENDPFAVIDLDNTTEQYVADGQARLKEHYSNTYIERSISGKGVHIIATTVVQHPGVNCRQLKTEVYCKERMLVITGCETNNKPVVDYSADIDDLIIALHEVQAADSPREDFEKEVSQLTPEQCIQMVSASHNRKGAIYRLLAGGFTSSDYNEGYSETSGKLMTAIVAELNLKDPELLKKVFFMSAWFNSPVYRAHYSEVNKHKLNTNHPTHWKRETETAISRGLGMAEHKAQKQSFGDDVVAGLLSNMTVEGVNDEKEALAKVVEKVKLEADVEKVSSLGYALKIPDSLPGLDDIDPSNYLDIPSPKIKEMIDFAMSVSKKPNPRSALTMVLGMLAGITGVNYQVSGTGLNVFMLYLGATGRGKEDLNRILTQFGKGIEATSNRSCVDRHFYSGQLRSGPAIRTSLEKMSQRENCATVNNLSYVYRIKEMGHALVGMTNGQSKFAGLEIELQGLYDSSSKFGTVDDADFARIEDVLAGFDATSMSIVGDTQPKTLAKGMSYESIESGTMTRLIYVAAGPKRPPTNFDPKTYKDMPPKIAETFIKLINEVDALDRNENEDDRFRDVELTEECDEYFMDYDEWLDNFIDNECEDPVEADLVNRSNLNALKLAGLIAVTENPERPLLTLDMFKWALVFIFHGTSYITETFKTEKDPETEKALQTTVRQILHYFTSLDPKSERYIENQPRIEAGCIQHRVLRNMVQRRTGFNVVTKGSFAKDVDPNRRFKDCIQTLEDNGWIETLEGIVAQATFPNCRLSTHGKVYKISSIGLEEMTKMIKELEG